MSRARATRALRRNAETAADLTTVTADVATVEGDVLDLACYPVFGFAVDGVTFYLVFNIPPAPSSGSQALVISDWTIKVNTVAQTTSAAVSANGFVAITLSSNIFVPTTQAVQTITVTYDGTDATFKDRVGSGRAIAAFTNFPLNFPRFDSPEGAFFLVKEQAVQPSNPASGYGLIWWKDDGTFHILNDGGTDIDLTNTNTVALDAAVLATAVSNALTQLQAGADSFNPGALFAEQASAPTTPASGYAILYADNAGKLHYLNDGAVNLTLHPEDAQFILASEVFR